LIDKYNSTKITALSFLFQIFVVLIHSINLILNFGTESIRFRGTLNSFVQNFITNGICAVAVPALFIISGYFFFITVQTGSRLEFTDRFKKRLKTLALPFLIWSVLGILLFYVLQSFPLSKPFFTKDLVRDYTFQKWLYILFYLPISAQLWFIRDLIILILLSPLFYKALKSIPKITLLACFILWYFNVPVYIFSNEALLFFLAGSYVGIQKILPQNFYKISFSPLILVLIWIVLEIIKTLVIEEHIYIIWLITLLRKTAIITGIVAIWYSYDVLYKNDDISAKKYYPLFQYSFWIFVTHQPLLNIIKKGLNYAMGFTNSTSFIIYILSPIITLLIIIPLAILLRKYVPKVYYISTGGR